MEMLTSQDDTTEPSYKLVLHQECVKSINIVSITNVDLRNVFILSQILC